MNQYLNILGNPDFKRNADYLKHCEMESEADFSFSDFGVLLELVLLKKVIDVIKEHK